MTGGTVAADRMANSSERWNIGKIGQLDRIWGATWALEWQDMFKGSPNIERPKEQRPLQVANHKPYGQSLHSIVISILSKNYFSDY